MSTRISTYDLLHPEFRTLLSSLLSQLETEVIPFKVFESYRTPQRQAELYAQGRNGDKRAIVTRARPWSSYHQYGLAADLVLFVGGRWSWDDKTHPEWWSRMHELAEQFDLETLSFEKPHVQLRGYKIEELRAGKLPGAGDMAWASNLNKQVALWNSLQSKAEQRLQFSV